MSAAPAAAAAVIKNRGLIKKLLPAAAAAVLVVVLAPVALIVIVAGAATGAGTVAGLGMEAGAIQAGECGTTGPITGLSDTQAANARAIIAAAQAAGGQAGAIIAIDVALTESGLRNLGNTSVPGTDVGQGMGRDHDSVGLFQQRPSMGWGTPTQLLDPTYATGQFMNRLVAITSWQTLQPWVAAQQIQQSAFDGDPRPANDNSSVVGGNYQAKFAQAQQIVTASSTPPIAAGTTATAATAASTPGPQSQTPTTATAAAPGTAPVGCDQLVGAQPANPTPGSRGLPMDYVIPTGTGAGAVKAITFALGQLHLPYVFGAAGPDAYDCSGLTMAAWAQAGVRLDHFTGSQVGAGAGVDHAHMMPGDLVLVPGSDGTLAAPRHVGMYIGDGLVVDAASTKMGILVQTWADFIQIGGGLSAIRHVG